MSVQPYLFFEGRTEEAISFYQEVLGAQVEFLTRYKDSPEPEQVPPGGEEKVMHATIRVGETILMMSDGHCSGEPRFNGFALSLPASDVASARRMFDDISAGGAVNMPFAETFWSPGFGMATDRFGVSWMVNVAA